MIQEKDVTDISVKTGVRIAGFSLLAMFIIAAFDFIFVDANLIVWDDAAQTFKNLKESVNQYRLHIFFFLLIFILDVVIALGLYLLLKPVNKNLSLLSAWFRVMYAAMIGAITVNQLDVLYLISGAGELSVFDSNQLHSMTMSSLHAHANGFSYALIFFSIHILLLAYLIYKSNFIPKVLGLFLLLAFLGYGVDGLANLLFPAFREQNHALFTSFLGIAGVIGELFLTLYIVIRGKAIIDSSEKRVIA